MGLYDRIAFVIFILSGAWIAALLAANKTGGCTVHVGYDIGKVEAKARALAAHSWEYGTLAEALLELHNPELSVFGSNPFPKDKIPKVKAKKVKALSYSKPHILTHNQTLCDGNGSPADPAALGTFAIMIGRKDKHYLAAALRQTDHLLKNTPRFANGAISHREDVAELWADQIYMAPTFLAYEAVAANSTSLLEEAIHQCELYREVLMVNDKSNFHGLWKHIVGPQNEDLGLWSTSNAWAAAGMARILAIVQKWGPSSKLFVHEQHRLKKYIKEILDGAIYVERTDDNGVLLRNYLDDESWFRETSGTALLAATTYRMAVLAPETFGPKYVHWANDKRKAVAAQVDKKTGLAAPAVNPMNHLDRTALTNGSPEGQAFLLLLYAAYRDCICSGVCSK